MNKLTLGSMLAFIRAHPRCTVNDIMAFHDMPITSDISDDEYLDRESTGSVLLTALEERKLVTFEVTSFDGWLYTAVV